MRVKQVKFTVSEINGTIPIKKDCFLDIETNGNGVNGQTSDIIRKYPLSMSVVNMNSVPIEIAIIGNETEEELFDSSPEDFYFLLPSMGAIGISSKIGRGYKVSCRKVTSNVTEAVRFDFMHHNGIMKIN